MVAIRQNAAQLKDHRQGGSAMPPHVSESPATFLQHYVPKTPGVEVMPPTQLIGYAAAVADASLFVPGAVQHGDVMKLVTAAGQSVLDNLPSSPLPTITSPPPPRRRMRTSLEGSGPSFSGSTIGGGGGGGGGNRSYSGSVPFGYQQTQKLTSRELQQLRDQQPSNPPRLSPPSLQQQQQQQQLQQQQQQLQPHHVTTVVAQPVAIPRTRMRVPSPGMARELGLEVPPPPPSQQASASALDRVSSLCLLPDPAGGKSRNGWPRAPHRTQLGLPFAGNVAMLVLENHSDLVKVVSSTPSNLDCVATLRTVTNMPSNVSYCDDDGQCEDGSYGSSSAEFSYRSHNDGVGHRVMVFAAQPVGLPASSTASPTASSPPTMSATASSPQTPQPEAYSVSTDNAPGAGLLSSLTIPRANGATETGADVAATHGSDLAPGSAVSPALGTRSDASGGGDGEGRLSPFSSMPVALNAIGYDEYFNRSNGGASSDGADISSGNGGVSELSWRSRQPYGGASSPLVHVEPLTLAASQSVLQMQNSMSSLGGGSGGGGGTPGGGSGVVSAAMASPQPLMPTASGRSAAALLSTASIPLAAGQVHVPLASVYRRMAPAPGAAGTAGAMLTPVLAATAVVQPAVSMETAKLCASRLTTVMSTGPMVDAAEANAGTLSGGTEAGNAAAGAGAGAGARAVAAAARLSSPSSLPPSTSSSYTRDHNNPRYGSPVINFGGLTDTSPLRSPPVTATASQDNVVLLPRMVVYETALLDATAAAGSGSSPASPRGGAAGVGGPTVRLASLGPAAASAAAAAASAAVPAGPGVAATSGHSPTRILPALPGTAVAVAAAAAAAATAAGAGASAAAIAAANTVTSSSPPGSPRLRPPPRMLRSMDAALPYHYGTSRELLGYFSSNPRLASESDDAGMVFTGGIGGRPVRYGSPGGQRRQGGGGSGNAAAARRIAGVSLRDLAGVNGIYRDESRNPMGRNAALHKAQEGPDLPLELDADAPSLQNRKLSEPSLDDLKYILTRWSKRSVACQGPPSLFSCREWPLFLSHFPS
ncbi:hypothetical protein Vafri_5967 [Volvox africanus]|nr:hypothetical protein Vafri_5967 [Volvox africanus]